MGTLRVGRNAPLGPRELEAHQPSVLFVEIFGQPKLSVVSGIHFERQGIEHLYLPVCRACPYRILTRGNLF